MLFSDFHGYLLRNKIFLSDELKEEFNKADDLLWDVLITRETGEQAEDHEMNREAYKKLKNNIDKITRFSLKLQ